MLNHRFAKFFSRTLIFVSFVQLGLASCGIFDINHPYLEGARLPAAVAQLAAMSWLTGWEFAGGDTKRGFLGAALTISLAMVFGYTLETGWLIPESSMW